MVSHSKADVAWIAGLFEGEGHIGLRASSPRVELVSTDLDVISRFHSVVGLGRLKGPYQRKGGEGKWKPITRWSCGGRDAVNFLQLIRPWLGERRGQRADEAIEAWTTMRKQTRASDTHCVHGHELTEDNTFATYGGKGRGCRTCRKAATARYRSKRKG